MPIITLSKEAASKLGLSDRQILTRGDVHVGRAKRISRTTQPSHEIHLPKRGLVVTDVDALEQLHGQEGVISMIQPDEYGRVISFGTPRKVVRPNPYRPTHFYDDLKKPSRSAKR